MNKKLILIVSLVCGALLTVALVLFFVLKPDNGENIPIVNPETENQQQVDKTVFVVPQIVNLYLSDTDVTMSVYVECAYEYEIFYLSENSEVLEISNGIIVPKSVGTTILKTTLCYKENEITKQTTINIFADVANVSCEVYKKDSVVDKLFIGEKYNLKLTLDTPIIGSYAFFANQNIDGLEFKEQKNNEYYYEFVASNYGEVEFSFKFRNVENKFVYPIYSYVNNFDVYINDEIYNQNFIELFLYNNNYSQQASLDGIFDKIKFDIKTNNFCLENCFEVDYDNNIIDFVDGYLCAKNIGDCLLEIKSIDGSGYQENITILVKNVEPTEIVANDISADVGDFVECQFTVLPIYAIFKQSLNCKNDSVIIEGNKVKANVSGQYEISITANKITKIIKFIANAKPKIVIEFPQSIIKDLGIVCSQDVITLNFIENYYIAFSYYFVDDKNNIISNNLDVVLIVENSEQSSDCEYENLRVAFVLKQKLDFSIRFLDGNNVYYEIKFEFF